MSFFEDSRFVWFFLTLVCSSRHPLALSSDPLWFLGSPHRLMNLLSLIVIEEIEQFLDLVLLGNKTFFAVCFSSVMCFLLCVSHKTASAKVCVDDKTPQDGIVIARGMPCVSLTSHLHFTKKRKF